MVTSLKKSDAQQNSSSGSVSNTQEEKIIKQHMLWQDLLKLVKILMYG